MSFLFDTCVISEFTAPRRNENVVKWIDSIPEEMAYLSAVSVGEIRRGIESTTNIKRRDALKSWLENDLLIRFQNRILPLDVEVLLAWGKLTGGLDRIGQPMPIMDSLIAATGIHHQLTIVTRDIRDFRNAGVRVVNPWSA